MDDAVAAARHYTVATELLDRAVLADREQEAIEWEAIPDTDDIRALIRRRLRRPRI